MYSLRIRIIILAVVLCSFVMAFVHPRELKAIQTNKVSQTAINSDPKANTFISVYGGNQSYRLYPQKDLFVGFEYGFVNSSPLCFRFGVSYGQNSGSSNVLTTIPLYLDFLLGYGGVSGVSAYIGTGVSYTFISESFSRHGFGYRWLAGIKVPSGPPFSQFFIEYNKSYLSLDVGNFENEILKLGCTIFINH